ncbi:MAG: sigma-54 dependent transcriptional regulator [Zoogloeaceae bacterium]|jgi:two-component system response regulator PilR (NtrC family)|nr:sigma-54 dependent transcriptional regulator [Zoogloeaceae bacterium]
MKKSNRVLVVDDEADIRELIDLTLARMGLEVDCAGSVGEAMRLLQQRDDYQLCLTDMRLPDGEGLQIVQYLTDSGRDLPVAVITAFGSPDNAVAAMKAGAFDYLAKPVGLDQLRSLVKSALRIADRSESPAQSASMIWGESPEMQQVAGLIGKLAKSQAPVYISGESGTGKEMAARQIHAQSPRAEAPFVPVNCGAIPESLMESEFFGYLKGAFTGAVTNRDGFFQAAHGGTLFLDEIADLPLHMQVKLLRVIQEKKVRKVGSVYEESVDVRIISATHRDLQDCVLKGMFRQDLYYRLNVIELVMPPLRKRREDIPLLAKGILKRQCGAADIPAFSDEAWQALTCYSFPGNVRELENVLERATALCSRNRIELEDLRLDDMVALLPKTGSGTGLERDGENLDDYLLRVERQAIDDALKRAGGNRTKAARVLGISFRSMRYRLERLGMERENGAEEGSSNAGSDAEE